MRVTAKSTSAIGGQPVRIGRNFFTLFEVIAHGEVLVIRIALIAALSLVAPASMAQDSVIYAHLIMF